MNKKIVLGIAVLSFFALCSCSSAEKSTDPANENPVQTEAGAEQPNPDAGTVIRVWNAGGLETIDDTGAIATDDIPLNRFTARFMDENPGVTVEVTINNIDDIVKLIPAASMSGELPDIIILWAGSFTNDHSELWINLEDYLSQDEIGEYTSTEICRENFSPTGKLQALPLDLTAYGIYYNRALLRQAGVMEDPQPKTWNELLDLCQKVKDAGLTPIGVDYSGYSDTWALSEFLADKYGNADIVKLIDGGIKMSDDNVVSLLEAWKQIFDRGFVNSDFLSTDGGMWDEMFANGSVAMRLSGSWMHKPFHEALGDDVGVFQIPAYKENAEHNAIVSQPGTNVVVTTQSKNIEMAVKFARLITGGEFQSEEARFFGRISSNRTSDTAVIENPLTKTAVEWLNSDQESVIGFDSLIKSEAANDFYKNVILVDSGDMTAKEMFEGVDLLNQD